MGKRLFYKDFGFENCWLKQILGKNEFDTRRILDPRKMLGPRKLWAKKYFLVKHIFG